MFRVLQDGKRCSDYGIPTWDVDTFETFREAEIFAIMWARPYPKKVAEESQTKPRKRLEYL